MKPILKEADVKATSLRVEASGDLSGYLPYREPTG
jgi:hypothetical protein